MSRSRRTWRGRGLRPRLIVGFVSVSVVTAACTVPVLFLTAPALLNVRYVVNRSPRHPRYIALVTLPAHITPPVVTAACVAAALLVVMIATAAALLASRTVLQPVGRLAVAAERVAAGDLDVRLTPDGDDELSSLVATFNTMTVRVQQSVEDLRRLEANARRFASDVSHELRSPLAAMTAVTEILEDRPATTADEQARATGLVVDGIARLDRLVEDLMEISRFDAGTVVLDRETMRVADAIAACLQLRDWTDRVSLDVPGDLTVSADRRRLDVILANLVGNAIKHGAAPIEILADTVPDGRNGRLRITVRDHGPGLPPERLTAVFDRFYKGDAARSTSDGSGLGLAIALENARLHNGTITVANAPGTGASFTLSLPVHGDAAD